MKQYTMQQTEVLSDIICDICGHSCNAAPDETWGPMLEYAILSASWGYCSNNKDMTKHECHMCEKCFDKVAAFIMASGGMVRKTYNL